MFDSAGRGHGRRLKYSSLCKHCVRIKCRRITFDRKSFVDSKEIVELLKKAPDE